MVKVKFKNWDCVIKKGRYGNDNLALLLEDEIDGELIATVTVNTDKRLPADQAYVKHYSENEGIIEAIANAGLVKKILGTTVLGWVSDVPLVQFNLEGVDNL